MADDDVSTSGLPVPPVREAIDAAKRKLREDAERAYERWRRIVAERQRAKMMRLAAVVLIGYLILRRR